MPKIDRIVLSFIPPSYFSFVQFVYGIPYASWGAEKKEWCKRTRDDDMLNRVLFPG
jgi:hypothetical protein